MNERGFLGVTAHFLQNEEMCMFYLATRALNERHTAEYISETLLDILDNWNISQSKICAVVTDNASSMLAAIRTSIGEKKHLPCFAHTINLVVGETLKLPSVKTAIFKVREIVHWIKNSVVQPDKLKKIQMQNNIPEGSILKLVADVKTRWNSAFFMLERFLHLRRVISEIVIESVSAPDMPTAVEMETLNQLTALLKPFEYVTREASGQKYVTISKIIPMINCLSTKLNSITPVLPIVKECKEVLLRELTKRYGLIECNDHAAIATLLDPRFKNLHFQDPAACGQAIQKLKSMIYEQQSSPSSEEDASSSVTQEYDFWKYHKELVHGHKKK
ncbi:zinc finger BED domain-containing protein 1-like [Nylanderia fulva]|nr:zinc finger BED domain-containing protein 1-like [Nylanderia fulva]